MAETISLEVTGKVPERLLREMYNKITPDYIVGLMESHGLDADENTVDYVTTSYRQGFPTNDLALRAFELEDGMMFWGMASGSGYRLERMPVKYLILEDIQGQLAEASIASEMNIADLNPETIQELDRKGVFRGKLEELEKIAAELGNVDNVLIGAYAAAGRPAVRE